MCKPVQNLTHPVKTVSSYSKSNRNHGKQERCCDEIGYEICTLIVIIKLKEQIRSWGNSLGC